MTEHSPSSPDHRDGGHPSFPESEMVADNEAPAARRRLPSWLLPTGAALAVGVLVGALVFGGGDEQAPSRTASAAPTDSAGETVPHLTTALTRAEPVQVDIPTIGVSSVLVDLGLNGDGTLEVPVDFSRAGWFTGGNYPGDPQGPPALIAGHVDDYTGPAVFYRLRDLAVGDEVLVTRADNTVAVFTVTDSDEYPKSEFPADEVYAPVGDSELVLITCTGAFDQTARSYDDNLVVRARLDLDRSLEESDARIAAGTPAPAADQPNV